MVDNSNEFILPGLGQVEIRPLSFGDLDQINKEIDQVPPDQKAFVFTRLAISKVIEKPHFTESQINSFDQDILTSLIEILIDDWEIREEFDAIDIEKPIEVRFYEAHANTWKKISENSSSIFLEAEIHLKNLASQAFAQIDFPKLTVDGSDILAQNVIDLGLFQKSLDLSIEKSLQGIEEFKSKTKLISEPLKKAGFWITRSSTINIVFGIYRLVCDHKDTPERIRLFIVRYYEKEHYKKLKEMVDNWETNHYFAPRMKIIRDALKAHVSRRYTLSIPTLLPLFEGILTSIIGQRPSKQNPAEKWAASAIKAMLDDRYGEIYKDAVLSFVTGSSLYGYVAPEYFFPEKFPEWLKNNSLEGKQILQRHAILHGIQLDYASKENSLRAFLLLDVLFWLENK